MTALPTPPVPIDCDLQDFPFMPLHVARLRDSDLASEASAEACWYAVLLWAASWHQLPAGSLPDSDAILTKLIGLGKDVRTFVKHKAGAMRGFVKCSDGRLYHPVVAEQVVIAWHGKLQQRWRTECARIKKANQRNGTDHPFPTFEQFTASSPGTTEYVPGDIMAGPGGQDEMSPGRPQGNGIQGTGTGTEESSDPNGSEAEPPDEPDRTKEAWNLAVRVFRNQGKLSEIAARKLFGKLLSETGLPAAELQPSLLRCELQKTQDPQGYMRRAAERLAERLGQASEGQREPWGDDQWRAAVDIFTETGRWGDTLGPAPGEAGCKVPPNLLPTFPRSAA